MDMDDANTKTGSIQREPGDKGLMCSNDLWLAADDDEVTRFLQENPMS